MNTMTDHTPYNNRKWHTYGKRKRDMYMHHSQIINSENYERVTRTPTKIRR